MQQSRRPSVSLRNSLFLRIDLVEISALFHCETQIKNLIRLDEAIYFTLYV